MSNLSTIKTAKLRKMAEEQEIKGWEDMEREALIEALKPKEEPEEEKEVDLNKLTLKALKQMAEEKGVDVKDLKKKTDLIEAIKGGEKKEPEASVEEKGLGEGIKEDHVPVGSKAERMREHLSKQPKVRILIPLEGRERLGITVPVTINGYRMNIMKGLYVNVPEQVAEIIMESQKQTVSALNNSLNLGNPKHPKKESGEGLEDLDV